MGANSFQPLPSGSENKTLPGNNFPNSDTQSSLPHWDLQKQFKAQTEQVTNAPTD